KFASRYLTREFFWDLHPPHGKMLLALAGRLFGLNGTFVFNLGAVYPSASETGAYLEWYIGMRIFCALFGAAVVPIAYFTGYELGLSFECCLLFAIVVLFDGALVQISKLILLDSMLLFFTALSLFCLVVFRNQQLQAPFSSQWFFWLFATGASLGCVV
ncbi:glycosyl transferase, partial [Chytriomyces sp. MP71]